MLRHLFGIGFAALVAWSLGCGNSPRTSILGDKAFVAIPRTLTSSETRALQSSGLSMASQALADGESFYLAIRRSELSRRFFLTGFLKQFHPLGVQGGAASQVGTRVVSFRIQNDKLFLFDVADIHTISDSFDPELVLEAWPVVRGVRQFENDPNSGNYVLIDPAAGLNRFSLLAEQRFITTKFNIEISLLQAFKRLSDGVAFDQIFTGEATLPIHPSQGGESNLLRASGTLGIALRAYREGEGFTQTRPPSGTPTFYFLSQSRILPNTGRSETTPIKWNIHPGMTPIRWTISPEVLRLANHPFYSRYDILGGIRNGVENWNNAFGYRVLEAVVGDPDATPADDVTNFIYVDLNPAVGFAFADWRSNPNTGEVRGASVYFSTAFIDGAARQFDPDHFGASAPNRAAVPAGAPSWSLSWAGIQDERLCTLPASPLLGEDLATVSALTSIGPANLGGLTGPELVKLVITNVILHEIGHTLGLRHNFKGSLLPPSSSVMDYLVNEDRIQVTRPGSWDADAVKYLYDLSDALPHQPFCNDDGTRMDPDCARFDRFSNPLSNFWIPLYRANLDPYLRGESPLFPAGGTLNSLLGYVRRGASSDIRRQAFDAAFLPVTGISPPGPGVVGTRVDFWSGYLQRRLFLDPASLRFPIVDDPNLAVDPELAAMVYAQEGGYLRNTNTVTSFPNRRTSVDILKKIQLLGAYDELVRAREAITATADPNDLQARDLLDRIDSALHPYFR